MPTSLLFCKKTVLDGKEITVSAKAGSTIITIDAATLEKLSVGNHTVTAVFNDGQAEIPLEIKDAPASEAPANDSEIKSPLTGNEMGGISFFSIAAVLTAAYAIMICTKKHSKNEEN